MSDVLSLLQYHIERAHAAAEAPAASGFGGHADFLRQLLGDGIKPARVNAADVETILELAGDAQKLIGLVQNIKRILEAGEGKTAVSYALYSALMAALVASIVRLSRTGADEAVTWVNDVVPVLRRMLRVFNTEDILVRLQKHKESPFYAKLKSLYKKVIEFFKRLWEAFKRLVKRRDEYIIKGEVDVAKLFGAGIAHIAILDELNSKLDGPRASLAPVKGLPRMRTQLRQVQMHMLEQDAG